MDIVRLLSICSIIWGHCLYDWEKQGFSADQLSNAQLFLLETGRMGTVCFFLLSGYFMSDKLPTWTVFTYLRARFVPIILPWVAYLSAFVVIQAWHLVSHADLQHPGRLLALCINLYKVFIFHAAYWFVPAALLCGCLLVFLNKQLNNYWLGLVLAVCTLFYSINLHYAWVDVNHTKAVAGYALFTWLGVMLKRHEGVITPWIMKLSWLPLTVAMLAFFAIACVESRVLLHTGSHDPFASIRLSNVILSLLFFVTLLKWPYSDRFQFLKPRKYVYGLYLVHSIVISELTRLSSIFAHPSGNERVMIANHLLLFITTLLISTLIVLAVRIISNFIKNLVKRVNLVDAARTNNSSSATTMAG